MNKITLYTGVTSSSSWRVRICLALKGIQFEPVWVDARKAGPTSHLTPMGQVPVLEIDERQITQSVAICEYLEETRPSGLLPKESWKRARVREMVETINSGIQPLQNAPVVAMIGNEAKQREWTSHFIRKGLRALEQQASMNGSHNFLFEWSDSPTLAEIFLVPQIFNATRYGIGMDEYPRIHRVYEHCLSIIPAFKATMPPAPKAKM